MHALNKSLIGIYERAQHCSLAEFNKSALREMNQVVAFDACALADLQVAATGKVVVQTLYLESTPAERFQDRSAVVGQEALAQNGALTSQDDTLVSAFRQRGRSVVADIAATARDPHLLSYCRKYETAHSLAFVSEKTFGCAVPTLGLWRANSRNGYTAQQEEDANVFIPHFIQAREINRRFKSAAVTVPASSAMVLSSLMGQVYFADDETSQLLQTEWREWTPPFLPPALMDALKSASAQVFVGKKIAIRAEILNGMLCLKINKIENRSAGLTAAESRVAMLAVRGMQYKEIAKLIDVAPATVRNQLHSVYRKLGVSNKTALAVAMAAPA